MGTDLLQGSCSASVLVRSRPSDQVIATPTVGWAFLHQLAIRKTLHTQVKSVNQTDLSSSSAGVSSSTGDSKCVSSCDSCLNIILQGPAPGSCENCVVEFTETNTKTKRNNNRVNGVPGHRDVVKVN